MLANFRNARFRDHSFGDRKPENKSYILVSAIIQLIYCLLQNSNFKTLFNFFILLQSNKITLQLATSLNCSLAASLNLQSLFHTLNIELYRTNFTTTL